MNTEQLLLKKWRSLPPDQQQEVIDFTERKRGYDQLVLLDSRALVEICRDINN